MNFPCHIWHHLWEPDKRSWPEPDSALENNRARNPGLNLFHHKTLTMSPANPVDELLEAGEDNLADPQRLEETLPCNTHRASARAAGENSGKMPWLMKCCPDIQVKGPEGLRIPMKREQHQGRITM